MVKEDDFFKSFPTEYRIENAKDLFRDILTDNRIKVVVLDDDPTGSQTVNDVSVYTHWDFDSLYEGFKEDSTMFFILTNSRSFSQKKTVEVHAEITKNILDASEKTGKSFLIISRGDSTLRGHYPIETSTIKAELEKLSAMRIDGEILIPFFMEGGRFTANDIHYVKAGDNLVPVGMTEFARDKTFGYNSSNLKNWIDEKTNGEYVSGDISSISINLLRSGDIELVKDKLMNLNSFGKIIVNSLSYNDLEVFCLAMLETIMQNKNFILRSSASITRLLSGTDNKSLLKKADLIGKNVSSGGIILVGSHVSRTTKQLEMLKNASNLSFVDFNQHIILDSYKMEMEINRVLDISTQNIINGITTVIQTRRDRFDLPEGTGEEQLNLAVKISDALTSIIKNLSKKPAYILTKGGITSSDTATLGLSIKKATVAGQIKPGIPVWIGDSESKFPGIPVIIFPGNVGEDTTLIEIVKELEEE